MSRRGGRAADLYAVDPDDPTMMQHAHRGRSSGRRAHSETRLKDHVIPRVAATSDRHQQTLLKARQLGYALFSFFHVPS